MSGLLRVSAWRSMSAAVALALVAGLAVSADAATVASAASGPEKPRKPRPVQQLGSAAGLPHEVDSDTTRFKEGEGGALGAPAPGQLPAQQSLLPVPVESKGHTPEAGPAETVQVQDRTQQPKQGLSDAAAAAPAGQPPGKSSFDAATSREVPTERGENTQVFANADGSKTLRVSEEPVNFLTPQGQWQPVDSTLVPAAAPAPPTAPIAPPSTLVPNVTADAATAGPAGWQTKAGALPVQIAADAAAPTVASVKVGDGQSIGFGMQGAAPVQGKAQGDTVAFLGAREHADVALDAGEGRIKETITLQNAQAPDTWMFPLALEGLAPEIDAGGNVVFKNTAGEPKAVIPHGWMMDSAVNPESGDGAASGAVSYEIVRQDDGRQALKVTIDRAWLNDPARVFPVKVDPSVLPFTPAANSVSIVENRNYFQTDVYRLGYNCDKGVCNNAAIMLNTSEVSNVLRNNSITGARLNLWNVHTYDCQKPREVTVHANTAPWNPPTVRYPGPAYGPVLGSATFGTGNEADGCGDGWGTINLGQSGADLIQGWVTGQPNYGLTVRTALNDPNTWKKFDTAANNGAKLDIDYTPWRASYRVNSVVRPVTAAQDGAVNITVTNTGATAWTASWAAGANSLHYRLFAGTTELSNVAWTPLPNNVNPGESATFEARIAKLNPGSYTLCWDMDVNQVAPFSQLGAPPLCQDLATANQIPVLTSMTPGSGYQSETVTPTLTIAGYDPDNYPRNYVEYRVEVCDVVGTDYRVNCITSGWSQSPSFTIWPLTRGKTYAWYGYVADSWAESARPNPAILNIVNRDPVLDAAWPPNGYTAPTLTPMLYAAGHDPDNWPNQGLEYKFEVCEVDGADARKNCKDSGWTASSTWTVPSAWNLRWAKSYAWYATIGDKGGGAGSIARPVYFTPQVPQPAVTSHLASGTDGKDFNVQVGNYTTSATDASVGAVGPDLTVRRTYNSLDPRAKSAFGEGWSSRWDMRAVPDQDGSGNVVVVLANGQQVRFGHNSDDTYAPPSGGFATFKNADGGGWILADKTGIRHAFDAAGKLTTVTDSSGRSQTFAYDAAGQLTRATDGTSGRYLDFAWTGAHVTTVTTNPTGVQAPGLAWSYSYDGDRLIAVCPPAASGSGPSSTCTKYEYGNGSQYRSIVTDGAPRSYWRLGDAAGTTAASQSVVQGGRDNGTYKNVTAVAQGALGGTPDGAAHFNGTSSYVDLPKDLVRANQYTSVELWFRTTAGGTLYSYSQKPVDAQDDSTVGVPVLYVGSDGKLRGQFGNGNVSPITTAGAVNDGQWHHAALVGQGTTQTLYLDGANVGTRSGEIRNVDPFNSIGAGGANSQWPNRWNSDPKGFFNGDIDEVAVYDRPLGAVTVAEHYAARRVAAQAVKLLLPSGRTNTQVVYDAASERVSQLTDANGGVWKLSVPSFESSSAPYAAAVAATAPKGYWRLNDREGSTGVNAVAGGAAASYTDVRLGDAGAFAAGDDTAAEFNGRTSVTRLPDGSLGASGKFSVELWFRTETAGVLAGYATMPLADADVNTPGVPMMYVGTDGKLRGMVWSTGPTPVTSANSVMDGRWHHAVLSVQGSGAAQTLYLDGAKVGSSVNQTVYVDPYVTVGSGLFNGTAWPAKPADVKGAIRGTIDEVAVYDKALDDAAVADHFTARGKLLSSPAPAYRAAVAGTGPWSYWRLDEPSGGQAASQQAVHEGVGQGSAHNTTPAAGLIRGDEALHFNGQSSYVELPQDLIHGSSQASIELWFKTAKPGVLFGTQSDLPGAATQASWAPLLYVGTDGKLHGKFYSSPGQPPQIVSTASVNDNAWHQAVLTTDGQVHTVFLDGVSQGSSSAPVFHENNLRNFVGAGHTDAWPNAPAGEGYFDGDIDEVAVYRKALDPATVGTHYGLRTDLLPQYRSSVEAASPIGYWAMTPSDSGVVPNLVLPPTTDAAGVWNVQYGVDGAFGRDGNRAMGFNGTSSYLRLPEPRLGQLNQFSVEMWFQAKGPGVLMGYSSVELPYIQANSPSTPMLYVGSDGHLRGLIAYGSTTTMKSPDTVMDGQWHHTVLTFDNTAKKQKLYLDGNDVGTIDFQTAYFDPYVTIGAGGVNTSYGWQAPPPNYKGFFTGSIDEVALYHQTLTPDTVNAHYAAGTAQTNSSLTSTISVTDPGGKIAKRTFDALRGRVLTSTDAGGATTAYAYDTGGFLHTVTDPNNNAVVSGHDARGNEISRTTCRTSNSCWTGYQEFFLNAGDDLDPRNDRLITTRDPRSVDARDNTFKTQYTYTAVGQDDTVTSPDGTSTSRTYTTATTPAQGGGVTPAGLLASVTQPGNRTTSYTYYPNGDLAAVTGPTGLVTRYLYDSIGRKLTESVFSDSVPAGAATVYSYDTSSRVLTATDPQVKNEITGVTHQGQTKREYDADGRVLTETASDLTGGDTARTTTYVYDPHGLLTSVTDPEGDITAFGYDVFGRQERQTNAVGDTTLFSYTPTGQQATTTLVAWKSDPNATPRDLIMESRAYDPAGRLASVTDAAGSTTVYQYNDDDTLARTIAKAVTQKDGSTHDIVLTRNWYDGAQHVIRTTTGNGLTTVETQLDAMGRPVQEILDPGGLHRTTSYRYSTAGDLIQTQLTGPGITMPETVDVEVDAVGRPVKQTVRNDDGSGRADANLVTTTAYDQRGLVTSAKSPNANAGCTAPCDVTTTYDILGRAVTTQQPQVTVTVNGQTPTTARPTTTVGYNTFGEVTHARDANGNISVTQVDKLGRATATTLPNYTPPGATVPLTATRSQAYDKLSRPVSATDALGRTSTMKYDQLGNVIEQVAPGTDTPTSKFTYTPTGLQLSATGPSGELVEATYDQLGRKLTSSVRDRRPITEWFVTDYAYDDASNVVWESSPLGHATSTQYNRAGQPIAVWDPQDHVTTFDYDGLGRPTKTTLPSGRSTKTAYSPAGRVDSTQDVGRDGGVRTATAKYDADGNVLTSTTPGAGQTNATYDAAGRLSARTEKVNTTDSITTSFAYDAAGNRTRFVDGRGNPTVYTYNTWGLPESTIEPSTAAHPNAADRTWTTIYDAAGQIVRQLAPGGVQTDTTYNPRGQITAQTGSGAEAPTTARGFTYDVSGRMLSATASATNTYTYNDRGLLLTTSGPAGASNYDWTAEGQLYERTDAAGTFTFEYDENGRLASSIDGLSSTKVIYGYDSDGNLERENYSIYLQPLQAGGASAQSAQVAPAMAGGSQRTYTYDQFGRLVTDSVFNSSAVRQTSVSYGYDADNHITTKTTTGVAGASTNTYTYDLAGRLTSHNNGTATTPYQWDAAGNRTKVGGTTATYDERNRLTQAGTSTYTYTSRGTRSSVTVPGMTRNLKFDAFEQMANDGYSDYTYDALGRVAKRGTQSGFKYEGTSNNLIADGTSRFARAPGGDLLSTATGSASQIAISDQHGDVIASLDSSNYSLAGSKTYDPYGKVTAQAGTNTSIGYQGGYTDSASGQVNMASRWYDPDTAAFDSRDTWTLDPDPSGMANRYAYATGDPLGNTDIDGHKPCCWGVPVPKPKPPTKPGSPSKPTKPTKPEKPNKPKDRDDDDDSEIHGELHIPPTQAQLEATLRSYCAEYASRGVYANECWNDVPHGTYGRLTKLKCCVIHGPSWGPVDPPPVATPPGGGGRGPAPRKPIIEPKPPHRPTAPSTRPPTEATPVLDQALNILALVRAGTLVLDVLQSVDAAPQPGAVAYTPPQEQLDQQLSEEEVQELAQQMRTEAAAWSPDADISRGGGDICAAPQSWRFHYGPLLYNARADGKVNSGAVAIACPGDTGSEADRGISPPGWPSNGQGADWVFARCHLIGDRLGGTGDSVENLVTCYHLAVNLSWMATVENRTKRQLINKQKAALYISVPIYLNPGDQKPTAISMQVYEIDRRTGALTSFCSKVIPNVPGDNKGKNQPITDYVRAGCGYKAMARP
ncbi:LamG-like jellyroll fold domain-containing protein [Yinghuangia seranimata]|uniref:LamG-like jellyroll fold domain-containing protein n=1 Tax=Yinghuangia seranimata TaxID=408067 RepID=UPI00248D2808|nr:LamG-like jellyroll fold domain-containing protein [Yinghuangia seranimata]MDI2130549.1 LamG domain-containing protein [Yinghuangia seranimata]